MKSVLFVQLPPPRFSFQEPTTNIHLAAGFVAGALEAHGAPGIQASIVDSEIVDVFSDRGLLNAIVQMRPAIVAMTLYVWNVQRSLFLAANIKRTLPGTMVLLGGPEVTPDNLWVIRHPGADAGVFGEGESRIVPMVEALLSQHPGRNIPGTFFKETGGVLINRADPLPWDLASSPYPYLNGKMRPSKDGTLFLETVRGCSYRCRYCYYHKAFRDIRFHPEHSIEKVLDLAYSQDSAVREIYLMDPTFNARKGFKRLLESMAGRRKHKDIAVHTELRADLLNREDVHLLKAAGLTTTEVGLQSINPSALSRAGRTGDPRSIAEGISLLKNAGIEVTTGIILGLPEDTPNWFTRTLTWLKQTGAYSVVHPFVLSVLPGTDFRRNASNLGLTYDPRPPYYVRSTATFTAHEIRTALLECEHMFDMELDYIGSPSLVDRGPALITSPDQAHYISKWVVDPERPVCCRQLSQVIAKASDPFIFWFRGRNAASAEKGILQILHEFTLSNPHACLRVILEYAEPPEPSFFQKAIQAAADPGIFLNRSYQPLYPEGEIVSPDFTLLLPDPGDHEAREFIAGPYDTMATVVWDLGEAVEELVPLAETPMLISGLTGEVGLTDHRLWEALLRTHKNPCDNVFYRDPSMQRAWNLALRGIEPCAEISEKILVTL